MGMNWEDHNWYQGAANAAQKEADQAASASKLLVVRAEQLKKAADQIQWMQKCIDEMRQVLEAVTGEDGYTGLPEDLQGEIEAALAKARGEQ